MSISPISPQRTMNDLSTVYFCKKRNDLVEANKYMNLFEPDCLSPSKRERFITLAQEGKYNEVLVAIWKDKTNRLDFLRSLEDELHAPLMFERVIAEFSENPTAETVNSFCVPLLSAAAFRVDQEVQCSIAPTTVNSDEASIQMFHMYFTSLKAKVEKVLRRSFASVVEDKSEHAAIIKDRVFITAFLSKTANLSSPNWTWHGMVARRGPSDQLLSIKTKREDYAQRTMDVCIEAFFKNAKS